jgi:hypothetical protein
MAGDTGKKMLAKDRPLQLSTECTHRRPFHVDLVRVHQLSVLPRHSKAHHEGKEAVT